jgi:hypothetical protein
MGLFDEQNGAVRRADINWAVRLAESLSRLAAGRYDGKACRHKG